MQEKEIFLKVSCDVMAFNGPDCIAEEFNIDINFYVRGLLEKYPTVFFYANTWWIII